MYVQCGSNGTLLGRKCICSSLKSKPGQFGFRVESTEKGD